MPIDPSFKAAIDVLTELASDSHPAYVRVNAAGRLANLLSPANPKHRDIVRNRGDEPDLPSTPVSQEPRLPDEHPYACYLRDNEDADEDEEASSAEEDDPL
ncbi:MAG: hypothetical protein F4066_05740 [Chloroflexi bacterium]|nr:hypothetical protein [Chloroflexota bacterium]MYF80836.1 hypothetical protein [Chloroflexota bacterium]MYI04345.1 hypothetical protein [Chloroflexota bacterium]